VLPKVGIRTASAGILTPGGPEVLRVVAGPLPRPKADEVLIRVLAAGVNRPDVLQRKGLYPPPNARSPIEPSIDREHSPTHGTNRHFLSFLTMSRSRSALPANV
jgi:hypothetical protein